MDLEASFYYYFSTLKVFNNIYLRSSCSKTNGLKHPISLQFEDFNESAPDQLLSDVHQPFRAAQPLQWKRQRPVTITSLAHAAVEWGQFTSG